MKAELVNILIGGGGLFVGLIIKDWFGKHSKLETKVDKLNEVITLNTLAVTRLEVQMKSVTDALSLVEELSRDVNKLGERVRSLQ